MSFFLLSPRHNATSDFREIDYFDLSEGSPETISQMEALSLGWQIVTESGIRQNCIKISKIWKYKEVILFPKAEERYRS